MSEWITSRQNSLLTHIRKLTSQRGYRRTSGEFLCDGVKLLEEAVAGGAEVTVVVTAAGTAVDVPGGVRHVEVPPDVMASISPMEAPQGVLFLCKTPPLDLPKTLEGRRYLVLDGLQDPGNVGTIWRTADAFGADGLILVHDCCDPFGHKTVRASMGAAFRLPVWEGTLPQVAALLAAPQIPLYATALREDTVSLEDCPLDTAAVVIGSEGHGISREALALCGGTIKIPMEPRCESLNAAVAAAVILWEMYRSK